MELKYTIKSTDGIHARLAVSMVRAASEHVCDMRLIYEDKEVDLKSILGLMSLSIPFGQDVILVANGNDADLALQDVINAIE